jgi:hypothetical protein
VPRPGINLHLGGVTGRKRETHASRWDGDGADRAERRHRLRIEAFEGFGKPPIPFGTDGMEQVLRSLRVFLADLPDRRIEVSEDSPDLLLEEPKAP